MKIDCEGGELDALLGIKENHWARIKQVVSEVHDTENRLAIVKKMLKEKGFDKIIIEQEDALRDTELFNIYALRSN